MPTKPGGVYAWATDANFASGPASGNPTKISLGGTQGFVPGNGIAAEHVNYLHNILGEWTAWLDAGTPTAVVDTTIVERDSNGYSALQGMNLGGGAGGLVTCTMQDNGANFFTTTARIENFSSERALVLENNSATLECLSVDNAGGAEAIVGTSTGTGAAIVGQSGQGATGNGAGVFGESLASGPGVFGLGGPAAGFGTWGRVQAPNSAGAYGDSNLQASSHGVQGVHNVAGATPTDGAAVYGQAFNGAVAVRGESVNGWAGEFTSAGTHAAVRLTPRAADPSNADSGSIAYNSTDDMFIVAVGGATYRRVHDSANGYAYANANVGAGAFNSTTRTTVASLAFSSPNEIRKAGNLRLSVNTAVRCNTANLVAIEVGIIDTTGGGSVVVERRSFQLALTNAAVTAQDPAAFERSISVDTFYSVGTGARSFDVEFRIYNGGAGGIDHSEIVFTADGMH